MAPNRPCSTSMPRARSAATRASTTGSATGPGAAALHVATSYDPYQDAWTVLPDMPDERAGTQGAAIGQRLFVPGGAQSLVFNPTDSMFVFDASDTEN